MSVHVEVSPASSGRLQLPDATFFAVPAMQLKALLHWVHPVKGFVYEKAQIVEDRQ